MIVGLVGKKRCGKDTVANWLVHWHNFTKYSLADPMKRAVKEIFMFSDEQLWGSQKEVVDARYNTTPRKILQVFGTELFQYDIYNYIPELAKKVPSRKLWINRFVQWYYQQTGYELINSIESLNFALVKQAERDLDVVIPDVRFPHEAEIIKELGGIIIRIYRGTLPYNDTHVSETEMEGISHDYALFNSGTLDDLYKQLKKLFFSFIVLKI